MAGPRAPETAGLSGTGRTRWGLVLAGLACVGVILGLVSMHVLTPDAPPAISAGHSSSAALEGAPVSTSAEEHVAPRDDSGSGCPVCVETQIGVSAACAVALLLMGLVLYRPRSHWPGLWSIPMPRAAMTMLRQSFRRPPTPLALCISRT